MPSIFDKTDPLSTRYIANNPMGILSIARSILAGQRGGQGQASDNLVGSNNAGLTEPGTTTGTPGPSSSVLNGPGPNPIINNGIGSGFGRPSQSTYGGGNNGIIRNMPYYNAPNTGGEDGTLSGGSSIVSFAAGGMMDEQGRAVRPGEPMRPPSAGTGRTLPSARFKVEPQMPQPSAASGGPALGAASGAPLDSAQIEQEAQRFVQQHPQEVQKIQEVIAVAMQMGELTPEELNMAVQLAKTALARPESYPQIRQFAIHNGLGTEQDIPQQLDQGLLYVIIVAGKSMQNGAPAAKGNAMQGQGPAPTQNSVVPEYKEGGMTGDKPHIAKLHAREYVVPEEALIYHGKKHFDKLVEQARNPDGNQQQ